MDKKRLKIAYVLPQTEVCAVGLHCFLDTSFSGGAGEAGDDGEITGAKGFGLDDYWGKLWDFKVKR